MRLLTLLLACGFTLFAVAQNSTAFYVAARSGLSIREKPDVNAAVLGKLPYGEKVQAKFDGGQPVVTEGFTSDWATINYQGKTGYVVSAYLFTIPPPKAGVKTLAQYAAQITQKFGVPLVVKKGDEETTVQLTKQLFKNGWEVHNFHGYEYGSETWFLTEFGIQQAFHLVRLLSGLNDMIGEKDPFPTQNSKVMVKESEKTITVDKGPQSDANYPDIRRIRIEYAPAAIQELDIFLLDGQVVIANSAGV